MPDSDERIVELAKGIRDHWMAAGTYLGEELYQECIEYRAKVEELIYFIPAQPSKANPEARDHLDLAELIEEKNRHADETMNLLHLAQQEAIGS